MAFSLIDSVIGAPGQHGGATGAIDTSGANLIVISISDYAASTISVPTDSKSNTYTPLNTYQDGGTVTRVRLYYCASPIVGASHTFTYATADVYPVIAVSAWSGGHASSPFDQQNGLGLGSTAVDIQSGSVTPSENDELVITAVGINSADPSGINGGFTVSDSVAFAGGNNWGGGMAYLIQTSLAAANPTWSLSGNVLATAAIATFKVAGAAPTGNPYYYFAQL